MGTGCVSELSSWWVKTGEKEQNKMGKQGTMNT